MFILMSTNVNGSYIDHSWRNKPTKKKLLEYLEGYKFDAEKVADELLATGI